MFSRRLLTISALITAVSGYIYFFNHVSGFIWPLSAGVLITMSAYIFQHQINWWWYQKHPPALDSQMEKIYMHTSKFYRSLDEEQKKKFNTRVRLFVEAKEFIAQGFPEVAEDVRYMVAYYAVVVSFHRQDFLFEPYNRIVIYFHPFLSPNFPERIHTYELEHEDGTLIFSLEQLVAGFMNPVKYYQTGLHAFAELYTHKFLKGESLSDPEAVWAQIENTGGWSKQQIEDFTGLPQPNPIPVMIHQWYAGSKELQDHYPEMYRRVEQWLAPTGS